MGTCIATINSAVTFFCSFFAMQIVLMVKVAIWWQFAPFDDNIVNYSIYGLLRRIIRVE